jgi:N-glycosylase/DNA lyase
MQHFMFMKNGIECTTQLPAADNELLPGVRWGDPCALFTPAYWYTQYLMTADLEHPSHRLGQTFAEELTICLLGGHGIPAEIGLAAFERLKQRGLIAELCTDQKSLECCLREPISMEGRTVIYRFWRLKAGYLAGAYHEMRMRQFPTEALPLRDELTAIRGVGPKTASWIVRNWLGSDEVAILDIHVVRAGVLAEVFSHDDDVTKHYLKMEAKFVAFAEALGVPTSDLDALIWSKMRATPRLVRRLMFST